MRYKCLFMILKGTGVAPWFQWTASVGLDMLTELDCKEQFNRVKPQRITEQMKSSSDWLHDRKHWRSSSVLWSMHRDHKKLDRAGQASAQGFRIIPHEALMSHVSFDLMQNNYYAAGGSVWVRSGCIPMGGHSAPKALTCAVCGAHMFTGMHSNLLASSSCLTQDMRAGWEGRQLLFANLGTTYCRRRMCHTMNGGR